MYRLLIALTLCTVATLAAATDSGSTQPLPAIQNSGDPEKPGWFKESFLDIREDVAEATASDQRVILYFYQDGCPYCTKLLRDNLGDRTIGTLARERFEVIAINIWGDREVTGFSGESTTEKQFAADLKVQFTPTMLLLDEAGAVAMRINGYFPPHRFGAALAYVSERRERTGQSFPDFYAATNPREAKGKLPEEGGFLSRPARLGEHLDASQRPLLVLFEQPICKDCDELHEDILRREAVAYSLSAFDAVILDAFSNEPVQTPDGRELTTRAWAAELGIEYTPSLVFFDADGREVFRTEGYLKAFHIQGALDYVSTGAYRWQPRFQRYLAARRDALAERGLQVDIME